MGRVERQMEFEQPSPRLYGPKDQNIRQQTKTRARCLLQESSYTAEHLLRDGGGQSVARRRLTGGGKRWHSQRPSLRFELNVAQEKPTSRGVDMNKLRPDDWAWLSNVLMASPTI
jgi:hypothetical protein